MKTHLTNQWLEERFGNGDAFKYATIPYATQAQYNRDKQMISNFSNAAKPQDKFMIIVDAKLERSPGVQP